MMLDTVFNIDWFPYSLFLSLFSLIVRCLSLKNKNRPFIFANTLTNFVTPASLFCAGQQGRRRMNNTVYSINQSYDSLVEGMHSTMLLQINNPHDQNIEERKINQGILTEKLFRIEDHTSTQVWIRNKYRH
jgi:hypothetical protein